MVEEKKKENGAFSMYDCQINH